MKEETPCAACGMWWLPGSRKCDKHDPAGGSYVGDDGFHVPTHPPPEVLPASRLPFPTFGVNR